MRITRVYTEQNLANDSVVELNENTSHYLLKVLRLSQGDKLHIFNGLGGYYEACLFIEKKRACQVQLNEYCPIDNESPASIHLGIGISRSEKMDFIFQKSTELGVTSFTPVILERSEFKLKGERLDKKVAHWKKVIISACEQCQRNLIPKLHPVVSFNDYLLAKPPNEHFLILDHRSDNGLINITQTFSSEMPINFLIGPEGGVTEKELSLAENAGALKVHLGPRVLRTETAPLAAIAILQSTVGDFTTTEK